MRALTNTPATMSGNPTEAHRAAYRDFTPRDDTPPGNEVSLWPSGWDRLPYDGDGDRFWNFRIPIPLLPYYCRSRGTDQKRLKEWGKRRETGKSLNTAVAEMVRPAASGPIALDQRDARGRLVEPRQLLHYLALVEAYGRWHADEKERQERAGRARWTCQACGDHVPYGVKQHTYDDGAVRSCCAVCQELIEVELAERRLAGLRAQASPRFGTRGAAVARLLGERI